MTLLNFSHSYEIQSSQSLETLIKFVTTSYIGFKVQQGSCQWRGTYPGYRNKPQTREPGTLTVDTVNLETPLPSDAHHAQEN